MGLEYLASRKVRSAWNRISAVLASFFLLVLAGTSLASAEAVAPEPLVDPVDLKRFAIFVSIGLVGVAMNYVLRWLRDEIAGSLVQYLFRDQPKKTALSFLTFAGAALTLYSSGQLHALDFSGLLMLAITTGYTCDSAINRGATPPAPDAGADAAPAMSK